MTYESMKEALEAILAIEKNSPAALGAVLLLAEQGLSSEVRGHLPHDPSESCGVFSPAQPGQEEK